MPVVKPFRGIHYSSSDELRDLVCPPYDVISSDDQARLHQRHAYNAVRLELARPGGRGSRKYREVAAAFTRWLDDGILVRDERPAFYVYRQDFRDADGIRRRVVGVIGALELEAFGSDSGVLPHERTMAGPIEDRLALMRACPVNISPIYAIYRANSALGPYLEGLENRPTWARFVDDAGTLHRLWTIAAPAETEMLAIALGKGPLVIADGHHRYETALAYRAENAGRPGGHDSIMCFCVDADAEDVVVLPYHRCVRAPIGPEELTARLDDAYKARRIDGATSERMLAAAVADHVYLFVMRDRGLLVEVREDDVAEILGDRPTAWRRLDVVALHEVVLPHVLPEGVDDIAYSKDRAAIERLVKNAGWTSGILLKPLDAVQVFEVARSGARMPQKASYFWPKAVTGLVFRSLDPED